jgi:tRNA pseudouridine55 synthase
LARDIGRDLGVGARLEALRRTQSGKFVIEDSIPMKRIRELTLGELAALLIPPERALAHLPLYQATSAEALKITHGSAIPLDPARLSNASRISAGCTVCVTVQDGSLLALAEPRIADAHTTLQPTRVFHLTENV